MGGDNAIEAVIFDLGGVVIDLDFRGFSENVFQSSALSREEALIKLETSHLHHAYEKGELSDIEFYEQVRGEWIMDVSFERFKKIWNSLLGKIPARRLEFMLAIGQSKRTFVLSNTNAMHVAEFNKQIFTTHGQEGIHALVEVAYYSHEMGKRKPELSIYEQVLDEQGLIAGKTLFIDDRLDNVEAAASLGIRTFQNVQADQWLALFEEKK